MMPRHFSRRDFLERAAGAAALAAVAGRNAGAQQARGAGMYISLNGSVARGVGWPDLARLAARVGFGGVDWSLGPAKTAGVDATKALFAELRIRPSIVNLPMARPLPFGGDQPAFEEALRALADDAAFTAAIGCDRMMLVLSPTGPAPKAEYRKVVRDRLAAISEVLQRSHLELGLEFLGVQQFRAGREGGPPPNPFIWTLPETVALAKDSGANIGVILDIWHWHHSGGTVADILAAPASRIVHVHLSDAKAQPPEEVRDNQRLMPGEGIIDVTGFLQALKKIGYAGGVSPEPLGRVPAEMTPEEGARLALETTKAAMTKAGIAA
ncbi:MAG: sugar phosphate isomerase/epimerase family protein [Acidobacteriota bacterium]